MGSTRPHDPAFQSKEAGDGRSYPCHVFRSALFGAVLILHLSTYIRTMYRTMGGYSHDENNGYNMTMAFNGHGLSARCGGCKWSSGSKRKEGVGWS